MTGSEVISALEKSSSRLSEIAFSPLASPISSTRRSGKSRWAAATAASAAGTFSVGSTLSLSGIRKRTIAALP